MKPLPFILVIAVALWSCERDASHPVQPPDNPPAVKDTLVFLNSGIILGNANIGEVDSVVLRFNKPVTVVLIRDLVEYCRADLNYRYADNRRSVVFSTPCSNFGYSTPFEFSVYDSAYSSLRD